MSIYLSLYLWSVFLQIFDFVDGKNKKLFYLFLITMPMIFISGLRDISVGIDTGTVYTYIFYSMDQDFVDIFDMMSVEPAYLIINWLVFQISESYPMLLMLISLITNILVIYSLYKVSDNVYLSVTIYLGIFCYFGSLCHMRQYLAVSFVMLAYVYLYENKLKKAIVILFVSLMFHTSSLLMVPFFLLFNYINTYKKYIFFMLSIVIGYLVGVFYFDVIVSFFPKYSAIYVNSFYGESRGITASIILPIVALLYLVCISIYDFVKKVPFSKVNSFYNMILLLYSLSWLASFKIFILNRLVLEYQVFLCLALPYIIKRYFVNKCCFNILINIFMFMHLFLHLQKNTAEIVPYTSIISNFLIFY